LAKRYPGIPENAEVIDEKSSFWGSLWGGSPGEITIRVIDEPERKGRWGGKDRPEKSHIEKRIRFKGRYDYRPEQFDIYQGG